MVINYAEFEEELIKSLKENDLYKSYYSTDLSEDVNIESTLSMFNSSHVIDCDEKGLFFFNEKGDKQYCPEAVLGVPNKGKWLSAKLPTVGFDIDQNGSVRKADEAEAFFCAIQVAHILKDEIFISEFRELAVNYDFKEWVSKKEDGKSWRELLNEWQNLQSIVINIIISAAKYKISEEKKSSEKYLRESLLDSDLAELRELESNVRQVNFSYSQGVLSATNVKTLSKISRLKAIDERDEKISELIKKSPAGNLYRATTLTTEYINPVEKKKILLIVNKEIDELLSEEKFSHLKKDRSILLSRFLKKALKIKKNILRQHEIEKYIKDPNSYVLPPKL
jgi:hypothetical protein